MRVCEHFEMTRNAVMDTLTLFEMGYSYETFEKCSISFKFKEGDNFNHRNTLSILRIKI